MTSEAILRRLGATHLKAVIEVERKGQSHPWSPAQLASALDDHQASVWGAFDAGVRLMGFAVLYRLPFDAELQAITVAPWSRRQGVARALLERMGDEARYWGSERFLLEVRASNAAALALYRQMGFEEDGRRRGYYPLTENGTREDAILMSRHL